MPSILKAEKQNQFSYQCKQKTLVFFNKNPLLNFIVSAFVFVTILLNKEQKKARKIIGE